MSLGSELKTPWSNRIPECRKRFSSARNEKIRQEMVNLMDNPDSVLEVGCGTQESRRHLNCNYVGLDFEPRFEPDVIGDAHDLPFGDNAFGTVVTKNCLQHCRGWKRALSEIMRVAEKRIVLAERTHNGPTRVVFANRNGMVRRRFNKGDLIKALEGWGEASFKLSKTDNRVGIYLGEASY